MRYYIDTEFNEFGGELLSLSLVSQDNESLYITYTPTETLGDWVAVNVYPHMLSIPSPFPGTVKLNMDIKTGAEAIYRFFGTDNKPEIIADWPDDIKYFCQALMTGPGEMVGLRYVTFRMIRGLEVWPNNLAGAVQHNAYWDAKALKEYCEKE